MSDSTDFARRMIEKYHMNIPEEVVTSVYTAKPKLPILLSRASFRPDTIRTLPETRKQNERRSLLRNVLGLMAVSLPLVLWLKVAFFSPQTQVPTYIASSQSAGGRLLSNATDIPVGQSLTLNDPTYGPLILIHLDTGEFVAFSAICTHAGCQVQFNPNARDIACPCHGAVYDPYNNAQVVAGPAPSPLQRIPIQYDTSTGNIYLAG
jgi:Rieske Fe-S protein